MVLAGLDTSLDRMNHLERVGEESGRKEEQSPPFEPSPIRLTQSQRLARALLLVAAFICINTTLTVAYKEVSIHAIVSFTRFLHSFFSQSAVLNRCTSITLPKLPGFEIISTERNEVHNYPFLDENTPGLNFCNVTVTLSHKGANDSVVVTTWLPLQGWNGRFLGTGGGGLVAGYFEGSLAFATSAHFAGASTDAGLTLGGTVDPSSGKWGLKSDGTLNTELVKNFADRSIHDMAVVSKAAIKSFYGQDPEYNYYFGCSTGGRMGYFAAQKYPKDFDGILANAPAVEMSTIAVADIWPMAVMEEYIALPQCIFKRYESDITAFCDPLDGVEDGLISDLEKCKYDTEALVGSKLECPDGELTITPQHGIVVERILKGATTVSGKKLFAGNPPGAPFDGIANTETISGITTPLPFSVSDAWLKFFVTQDPNFDSRHITFSQFEEAFANSAHIFKDALGVSNPDLSEFKGHGGKILTWHGLADPLINPEMSIKYRLQLEKSMGGAKAVDEFQRLFFAPGAGHCGGGHGPVPDVLGSLNVLREWVESNIAPDTLAASVGTENTLITRDLCRYPLLLIYDGKGDINLASSFTCG